MITIICSMSPMMEKQALNKLFRIGSMATMNLIPVGTIWNQRLAKPLMYGNVSEKINGC